MVAVLHTGNIVGHVNEVTLMSCPVGIRMGDHLWVDKLCQLVTVNEVNSAF